MSGFARVLKAQQAPDYAPGGQLVMMSQALSPKVTALIANDSFAVVEVWGSVMTPSSPATPTR